MKILAMFAVAGILGAGVSAAADGPAPEATVILCMNLGNTQQIASRARTTATEIFQRIGVRAEWRHDGPSCPVASGAIRITLSEDPPRNDHPGSLAYAMPFEGTHIVVFYDRMRANHDSNQLTYLLAYVLVHEVTHILQGISYHPRSGIMKARWNSSDYISIQNRSLGLSDEDAERIRAGLAWRETRPVALRASSPRMVRP